MRQRRPHQVVHARPHKGSQVGQHRTPRGFRAVVGQRRHRVRQDLAHGGVCADQGSLMIQVCAKQHVPQRYEAVLASNAMVTVRYSPPYLPLPAGPRPRECDVG
jgi:hypothetical protein